MKFGAYEDIVQITKLWTGERYPDGRPKVPSEILERIRCITIEEAWGPLWEAGYKSQFEGRFKTSHNNTVLVGRAVTGVMVPKRPDLNDALMEHGLNEEGREGFFNQWIIDTLVENDVVVIDLFDKIYEGTFVGGNLGTAIATKTKRGGSVIWGGVRDLDQLVEIPNIQTYHRGNDPTGIANVTLIGLNGPCRIGKAICLPGDVVLGTSSGVIFIPAHLAEVCADEAEKSKLKDVFGFQRLKEGVYTTAQIDAPWLPYMFKDFFSWAETNETAKKYNYLNWEKDVKDAKQREESGDTTPQIRL